MEPELEMLGETVSHFRVIEKIGEGGMGEVYLAQDTSLNRKAALKFLSLELSEDAVAHARLLREARSAAALDHPYICSIFEIGVHDERSFIAMEYVEGRTLKEKLGDGPLPLDEALRITSEISEALEKAHSEGIVHRDLKPSNVMLTTDGHVKVLDFGVAKRLHPRSHQGSEDAALTTLTPEGALIGTLAYMSPEQLRGDDLDGRSDIFSLGIVCYEMLAGVHPFLRSGVVETASAILKEDPPPLARYRENDSELLQHTLHKMLARRVGRRYQSAHEVHTDLAGITDTSRASTVGSRESAGRGVKWARLLPWALVPVAALAAAAGTIWIMSQGTGLSGSDRDLHSGAEFILPAGGEISLPGEDRMAHWLRHGLALSPDGQLLTFVSGDISPQERWRPARTQIYVRSLNRWLSQGQAVAIPGTVDGYQPIFSPDGRSLAFVQWDLESQKYLLRKIRWDGGGATTLCETNLPFGATWGPQGILFAEEMGGLFQVSSSGGEPQVITQLDRAAREVSHRLPHFLPDGDGVLYTSLVEDVNPNWSRSRILLLSLSTGESKLLIEGGSDARYVASGHVVFAREGSLMAVPFDLEQRELIGQPSPILEGVNHSIHTGGEWFEVGAAQFTVSADGLLAYAPGSVFPEIKSEVVWVDRQGQESPSGIESRRWVRVRVSADGRKLLLAHWYFPGGLWLYDLDRQLMSRQTFSGPTSIVVWGPEPNLFTMSADRQGFLVKQLNSGPGAYERRPEGSEGRLAGVASSWSSDGRWLSFVTLGDIWMVSSDGLSEPLVATRFTEEFPELSPDGRWLAYTSDASGQMEVYVRSRVQQGPAVQVSTQGGRAPAWSRDGAEILYRQGTSFMSVAVAVRDSQLQPSPPQELFSGGYMEAWPVRAYDVAPDGRFLLIKEDPEAARSGFTGYFPSHIRLVPNWFQEIEAKLAGAR